ncbi:hypothetical protein [Streptomyces sp. NBC_01794]|uniref:hypothetical protein n=1 Tax=Streptomyces sp. NBC_01794 TaxID=2975942 RepID=UPI003085A09D|nr:hypothetical protein OIE54_04870 [Streptomyces sp. NBC_01794]
MSTAAYELQNSLTQRTDIEIVSPELLGKWEPAHSATPMTYATAVVGWLMRAELDFSQSFVRQSTIRAALLSAADELSAQFSNPQTMATTVTVTPPPASPQPLSILKLVDDLILWLDITYEQLSQMVGVSRGTFFYWRQSGVNPRPNNSRPILRLHAILSLLIQRFGQDGARAWLHSDAERTWEALSRGDLDSVEMAVRRSIMTQPEPLTTGRKLELDEQVDVPSGAVTSKAPRKASRRPTKGRVSNSDRRMA